VQIQLTSGAINIHVRRLDQNDYFEVDTPNLAFTVNQPGIYRIEASDDGTYTAVSVRDGRRPATGGGQTSRSTAVSVACSAYDSLWADFRILAATTSSITGERPRSPLRQFAVGALSLARRRRL